MYMIVFSEYDDYRPSVLANFGLRLPIDSAGSTAAVRTDRKNVV